MVEPGPAYSVADVHAGWRRALADLGCQVVNYNLGDRLTFYSTAEIEADGGHVKAFDPETVKRMAMQGVEAAALRFWPDVVVVTSGFYMPAETLDMFRSRGMKTVLLHTESPYEDDRQLQLAPHATLNIVNDPTNIDTFQMVSNARYLPHAYDPAIHHPGRGLRSLRSDVAFVGTGYESRIQFFEKVDWSGLNVKLAGNWQQLTEGSPLHPFLLHDLEECLPNDETVDVYRSTKVGLNLYRAEANMPSLSDGWAMGPREVEMAACGTFFLRQPRGESDETFPMLPSFTDPDELGELCRWWVQHDTEREQAARAARAAVDGWTFSTRAEQMLGLL